MGGKFYLAATLYYQYHKNGVPMAIKLCENAISLAMMAGNDPRHAHALHTLAWIKWHLGDYIAAKLHGYGAQKSAKACGDLYMEALSLNITALSWFGLGNYRQSLVLCDLAINLLGLCGLSEGGFKDVILASKAEIQYTKSEYAQAHSVQTKIAFQNSADQDPYLYANAVFNIAKIDLATNAPEHQVQKNIDTVKSLSTVNTWYQRMLIVCEHLQADLKLRQGDISGANILLCRTLPAL